MLKRSLLSLCLLGAIGSAQAVLLPPSMEYEDLCGYRVLPPSETITPQAAPTSPSVAISVPSVPLVDVKKPLPVAVKATPKPVEVIKVEAAPVKTEPKSVPVATVSSQTPVEKEIKPVPAPTPVAAKDHSGVEMPTEEETAEFKRLAHANNCLACHSMKSKVVGPSYRDVSKHYAGADHDATQSILMKRISEGTSGRWGNIAMPANDTAHKRQDQIEKILHYILTYAKNL